MSTKHEIWSTYQTSRPEKEMFLWCEATMHYHSMYSIPKQLTLIMHCNLQLIRINHTYMADLWYSTQTFQLFYNPHLHTHSHTCIYIKTRVYKHQDLSQTQNFEHLVSQWFKMMLGNARWQSSNLTLPTVDADSITVISTLISR